MSAHIDNVKLYSLSHGVIGKEYPDMKQKKYMKGGFMDKISGRAPISSNFSRNQDLENHHQTGVDKTMSAKQLIQPQMQSFIQTPPDLSPNHPK